MKARMFCNQTAIGKLVAILIAMFGLSTSGLTSANYTTVPIPILNADIGLWTDGWRYEEVFPGNHVWNGVPFSLVEDASGNKVWYQNHAPFTPYPYLDIPVGVFGVVDAYTIMNTTRGISGATVGSLEFFGSAGAYQIIQLIEGRHVRDHYFGDWSNNLDPAYAQQAWPDPNPGSNSHLDMQTFHLDATFADETLVGMRLTNKGLRNPGQPFLAAVTVYNTAAPVPEPETYAMMLAGLAVLGAVTRRRKQKLNA